MSTTGRSWAALLAAVLSIGAGNSAEQILAEAKRVNDDRQPLTDRQTTTMRIVSSGGSERRRELLTYTKRYRERQEEVDKRTLAFFLGPSSVEDVGFLQWSHLDRDADQWLYLPRIKRVRRISQSIKDESFQGSDFSYRDLDIVQNLLDWDPEMADASLQGRKDCEGAPCAMIDMELREALGDYHRLRVWIDEAQHVIRRLEFYGDNQLLKELEIGDYRLVDGVPVGHRLEMHDVEKGSKTFVTISEVRHDLELSESVFTTRTLQLGPQSVANMLGEK